ncbi:MAG: HNH endonuclease [Clostridium sp.]|uniref:HNH endonuclease n=1 Tax=Clostridium sp. TaxID=1506 RepID=UPI003F3E33D4
MKKCNECGQVKEVECFEKSSSCKDGYRGTCKDCRREKKKRVIICKLCGKQHRTIDYKTTKYCDECCRIIRRKRVTTVCDDCGKEFEQTHSYYNARDNHFCTKECYYNYMAKNRLSINNTNFNPNISYEIRVKERKISGMYRWRKDVYEKFNHTCQCCGSTKNIVAHHIFNYKDNFEKALDLENGIVLCSECHKLFHREFGYSNNTQQQLLNFFDKYKTDNTEITNKSKKLLAL